MDTFVELVLVFRALHRSVDHDRADRSADGRCLDAGRSIYRRHRARDPASALQPLLHPRHEGRPGMSGSTSRSPACSPKAWWCTRPIARQNGEWVAPAEVKIETRRRCAARHVDRDRRAGRDRPDRENVEVEAQHRRSRRDHRGLRRRCGALVHAVGLAAGARRRMDRARRAGRLAVRAAAVAAGRRGGRNRRKRRRPSARRSSRRRRLRCARRPTGRWPTSPTTSKSCTSMFAWRTIYEFANALNEVIGDADSEEGGVARGLAPGRCERPLTFLCNCFTR